MQAMIVKVRCRQTQVLHYLALDTDSSLLYIWLHVVWSEHIKVRVRREACGRRTQYVRVSDYGVDLVCGRRGVVAYGDSSDVDSVLRVSRA